MSELKRGLFPRRKRRSDVAEDVADRESVPPESVASDSRRPKLNGRLSRRKKKKKRKKRRRLTLAVLPTMLTLGNAVCGLAAIAVAVSTNFPWPEYQLFVSGVLIFGGMLFDALDGSAARMTGQESQFGAELDSLCDAVTFGTAPAIIIWQMNDVLWQRLTFGIGVLFTLCVLVRLARFNVETDEDDTHEGFEGLPSPAAAGTIAAFAIAVPELKSIAIDPRYHEKIHLIAGFVEKASHFFIPVVALALAYLMVSRFQYPHIVQQWVRGRRTLNQIGQGMFALFGVILLHSLALPMIFSYYAFGAPVRALINGDSSDTLNTHSEQASHDASDQPEERSESEIA